LEAFGAGDFVIQAPNSGRGQGRLEDFSWNPSGWTLAARNFSLTNIPMPGSRSGLLISGKVNEVSLAAKAGEVPVGAGRGTLEISAQAGAAGLGLGTGRAKLIGQVRGDGRTLLVSVAGPVEGFGKGGPGARQGRLALDAKATRANAIWNIDLNGRVGMEGFRSPHLNVLDLTGQLKGRARVGTLPNVTRPRQGVDGLSLADLSKWDANLTFDGSVDRLTADGFGIRAGVLKMPIVARGDGRSVEASGQASLVASTLALDETHIDDVQAELPFRFSVSEGQAPAWQANASISATAASLTSGDSFIEGLRVSGPVQAIPADEGSGILVRGDTCLSISAKQGRFPGDATVGPVKASF
jgi:hypothetical protein